jgi:hypothetical protein
MTYGFWDSQVPFKWFLGFSCAQVGFSDVAILLKMVLWIRGSVTNGLLNSKIRTQEFTVSHQNFA